VIGFGSVSSLYFHYKFLGGFYGLYGSRKGRQSSLIAAKHQINHLTFNQAAQRLHMDFQCIGPASNLQKAQDFKKTKMISHR